MLAAAKRSVAQQAAAAQRGSRLAVARRHQPQPKCVLDWADAAAAEQQDQQDGLLVDETDNVDDAADGGLHRALHDDDDGLGRLVRIAELDTLAAFTVLVLPLLLHPVLQLHIRFEVPQCCPACNQQRMTCTASTKPCIVFCLGMCTMYLVDSVIVHCWPQAVGMVMLLVLVVTQTQSMATVSRAHSMNLSSSRPLQAHLVGL